MGAETVVKEFSVVMSLVDYIPVALFTIAAIILQRDLFNKMSKGAFAIFAAGTFNISFAGALKATYKLLYALHICDFDALNVLFFPVQSFGFVLAGIGIIAMFVRNQGSEDGPTKRVMSVGAPAVAPVLFKGTFLFVGLMVTGLACIDCGLSVLAVKVKKAGALPLLVLSFMCCLCMGYLSSRNFSKASMNWMAEGINTCGQALLLIAVRMMHKAGLADLKLN